MDPQEFISPKSAAKILGVDRCTIYRYLKCGKLRGYKCAGSRIRLKRADVLACLELVRPDVPMPAAVQKRVEHEEALASLRRNGVHV